MPHSVQCFGPVAGSFLQRVGDRNHETQTSGPTSSYKPPHYYISRPLRFLARSLYPGRSFPQSRSSPSLSSLSHYIDVLLAGALLHAGGPDLTSKSRQQNLPSRSSVMPTDTAPGRPRGGLRPRGDEKRCVLSPRRKPPGRHLHRTHCENLCGADPGGSSKAFK